MEIIQEFWENQAMLHKVVNKKSSAFYTFLHNNHIEKNKNGIKNTPSYR